MIRIMTESENTVIPALGTIREATAVDDTTGGQSNE